jgi:hypothetical protein
MVFKEASPMAEQLTSKPDPFEAWQKLFESTLKSNPVAQGQTKVRVAMCATPGLP